MQCELNSILSIEHIVHIKCDTLCCQKKVHAKLAYIMIGVHNQTIQTNPLPFTRRDEAIVSRTHETSSYTCTWLYQNRLMCASVFRTLPARHFWVKFDIDQMRVIFVCVCECVFGICDILPESPFLMGQSNGVTRFVSVPI